MAGSSAPTGVWVETGRTKVFVGALDWPGWCRAAKSEAAALDTLASYATRYAPVAAAAGVRFATDRPFVVVERAVGSATTDFGAPGVILEADRAPLTAAEARRRADLLAAAWDRLDAVVAAVPAELRKGPRGGGRDRDAMAAHVTEAELAYAAKLGLRLRQADPTARRAAILDTLRAARSGAPTDGRGWPARYAAARMAWHVLDHAWEMEDRATP